MISDQTKGSGDSGGRLVSGRLDLLRRRVQFFQASRNAIFIGGTIAAIGSDWLELTGVRKFAQIGDLVSQTPGDLSSVIGVVVQISANLVRVKATGRIQLSLGESAFLLGQPSVRPCDRWIGHVFNSLGYCLDDAVFRSSAMASMSLYGSTNALRSSSIDWTPFRSGVRVIDLFTPLCYGQRVGVFAGSGVGKSTLLDMLVSRSSCDIAIMAFVGERRREVSDFLARTNPSILARSICVVATSDESALMRQLAPLTAMTIAEYFRDQGLRVLLVVDSLTRYAHAVREILLAGGAAPVARGYPASMTGEMARLLERAGHGAVGAGSITGVFSVLVDGDDHNDPVADAARGILDGHIVLDRQIAERPQYPPVDILKSISRLVDRALEPQQMALVTQARKMISAFEDTRDLRSIGAYQRGLNPAVDRAIDIVPSIYDFLSESPHTPTDSNPFGGLEKLLAR